MRRSAPDSGVLIRLKAQMAEVRSKMSDVKSQVMEVRGAEPRPGTSGGLVEEESPSQHGDSKPGELELLDPGAAAAARSRPCRHGKLRLLSLFTFRRSFYWPRTAAENTLPAVSTKAQRVIRFEMMLLLLLRFIVNRLRLFFLCSQFTKASKQRIKATGVWFTSVW